MSEANKPYDFSNTLTVRSLKDYATRTGYDALKYIRSSAAINPVEGRQSGTSTNNFSIWVATSANDLIEKMSLELDLRAYYLGAEAGVAAKLISTFEMKETSIIIIARQTIEARNETIVGENLTLSDEAMTRLQNDLGQFHRKFGGYYCHTVVMGGELYVAYQCVTTTRKRATDISGKIDVTVPDVGSLMASMSSIMSTEAKDTRWRMTAQTQGAGGTIGDFDPSDPASVQKAILDFMRTFEEEVRKNPEPYYGEYDGYWRYFDAAAPLKNEVLEASRKVEALSDWGAEYADNLATINAFLDPKNTEGYLVTEQKRKEINALKKEIEDVWKTLRDAYDVMELFEDFRHPSEIEGVKDHPPVEFAKKIEAIRKALLAHLVKMGQSLRITLTEPGRHLHDSAGNNASVAPQDEPDEKPAEGQYVRLAKQAHTKYVLKPVTKKAGDDLCHGDIVNLVHDGGGKLKGQMIYMPDVLGIWTVRLFNYDKNHHEKYEWRVNIEGCKDKTRRVTTSDTLWFANMNDETCYLCVNSTDYLGVTRSDRDEWKIGLSH